MVSYNGRRKGATGKRSAPLENGEKPRLIVAGAGGVSYAFRRTTRIKSVTKSNAIKSFIVMGNAPLLTYPRGKPEGRNRLANRSYAKTSRKSSSKSADARMTLTAQGLRIDRLPF